MVNPASSRRIRQAGATQVLRRVEVENDPGIVRVDIVNAGCVGVDDVAGALVLGRGEQLGEYRAIEDHRMTTAALVSRDHDRLVRLFVRLGDGRKRCRSNGGMVGEVNDSGLRLRAKRAESDLQRRKLT